MSVPKSKRGLSQLEFYHTAIHLRRDITILLLRDFGIKDKVHDVKILSKIHGIEPQDEAELKRILGQYNMDSSIIEEFPEWLVDKMRCSMMDICRDLIMNITAANSIYAVHESEYYERRNFQNRAIGNCEQLLQEMQYILSVIPVDANKYMSYVETIERENALLKGWRKSDNRLLREIRKKGKERAGKEQKAKENGNC